MAKVIVVLMAAGVLAVASLPAQVNRARSSDYLLTTTVQDARALWLNPAGLGVVPEASIMGEFLLDRDQIDDSFRLGQLTFALNTRGLSVGYQRDRFANDVRGDTYRFGMGLGFRGGALGAAFTLYRGTDTEDQDFDLGLRYRPNASIELGGVVQHLGRPEVRGVMLPLTVVGGASWSSPGGHLVLGADLSLAERIDESGLEADYIGAFRFSFQERLPLGLFGRIELESDAGFEQLTLGFWLGGQDRLITSTSAVRNGSDSRLEAVSLTGLAARLRSGRFP